jgi:hypothetical protein
MADEPNKRELALAARVNELEDADAAPTVAGVGMFSLAVNFLMRRVTKEIMTIALLMFIAYHGWAAFNDSQQSTADLQTKRAEAGQMEAEAAAINSNAGGGSMQLETLLAQISKTQAEADQAKADAEAQNQMIDGTPAAVAQKKAEVETEEQNVRKVLADHRYIVHVAKCYQQGIGSALMGCK